VTFYPTIDQVIAVHAELIARFGAPLGSGTVAGLSRSGAAPVRLLRRHHSGSGCTLGEPLTEPSVCGRQQACRGNCDGGVLEGKRYRLEFDDLAALSFLIGLYESGRMRCAELEKWLRRHATRYKPRD